MTFSVFGKIKKYNKQIIAAVIAICAVGLCVAVILYKNNSGEDEKEVNNTATPTEEVELTSIAIVTAEPTVNPIKINYISELPAAEVIVDKLEIEKNKRDAVKLDYGQAVEYYGTRLSPELPQDLLPWDDCEEFEIYKYNGGTGDVYSDVFVMNYSDSTMMRHVNIEGAKDKYHIKDIEDWYDGSFELSLICGERVYVAFNAETNYYFAEFVHNGVGFRIIMAGLNENEVLTAIKSLIN